MKRILGATVALALIIAAVTGAQPDKPQAHPPVPVSPGKPAKTVEVATPVPTFSWGRVEGADRYELVVFAVSSAEAEAAPAVRQVLPGAASSWTPSLELALPRGASFAWTLRALYDDRAPGEWAPPLRFRVGGTSLTMGAGAKTSPADLERGPAPSESSKPPGHRERTTGPAESASALRTDPPWPGHRVIAGGTPPSLSNPSLTLDEDVSLGANSNIFKDDVAFLWDDDANTGMGRRALSQNTGGINNTALGRYALRLNTEGDANTAVGAAALYFNTSGWSNTAVGASAMAGNMIEENSTAVGAYALVNSNAAENTAVGSHALFSNTSGVGNTALGNYALWKNTTARFNTATGGGAMVTNTTGYDNVAMGVFALASQTTGHSNTGLGLGALRYNVTGDRSTAVGKNALLNSTGNYNSAVGYRALEALTSGSYNTAIGERAGALLETGSNNIFLGTRGTPTNESSTIRIGIFGVHSRAFVQGILSQPITSVHAVHIDASGQLGMMSSSRRYKEEIRDVGDRSEALLRLRPVTFLYKDERVSGERDLQFGLVAEEVAEVMPELISFNSRGEPETVRYHLLASLLLNELQEQQREIEELRAERIELALLRERLAKVERVLAAGDERLAGVTATDGSPVQH